ncbi:MAG: polyphosphate kinase 1 [Pyrinomonadaceae bacterium]|nr:polyphosphate kinase 1 [Pyrinomonadaceae bacterium]MBP6211720.1 polyphosphate kinase 1 [Pyrinomonadaceae bacterium]
MKQEKEQPAAPEPQAAFDGQLLFNRELAWLEFNRQVLEEAFDAGLPVLERLKFLSIFSTNLDEFFMIRVSGLKEQVSEGISELSPDGMTAEDQLTELRKRLKPMLKRQVSHLHQDVLPALEKAGITIESYKTLNAKDKKRLDKYFRDNLFPILTPQSVDSSHPFPYISNLSLNLGLFIEPDRQFTQKNLKHLYRQKRFTRIKLPPTASRLIPIDEKKGRYALLEEVIAANVHELFPNMKTSESYLFRVTRDADIELREDEAGDLLRTLERELQRRRDRFPVRLEVSAAMPDKMLMLLAVGIGLDEMDIDRIDGMLDIPDLMQLYGLPRPSLKDKPIQAHQPLVLHGKKNVFEVVKRQDVLLHHPYTTFNVVSDFMAEAADDPDVQAIKICLYRTGKDSPIVDSLMRASRLGKQVTALVELKARFDEENNIEWARRLENEGVHVVYGISSLKTHSKVMLVIRREKDKLVRYVHLATGNYNPTTSKIYTDLGLLTTDEEIGADASNLFNLLTGYSQQSKYHRLLVAPLNMRERLTEMIRREIKHKAAGKPARIIAKFNSLTDVALVKELYAASKAGVEIDLIVRGICVLRPGIKGLSENIRVRSVIGRFLEHSRVFYFGNGAEADEEIYMGSADWMMRNLDRRIEVILPILDAEIRSYLKNTLLDAYLRDDVNARVLRPDGTYKKVATSASDPFDSQMFFVGRDTVD